MQLDDIDKKIYEELERDSRRTVSYLSHKVGLSMPAVSERLRRLKNEGIIAKFTVRPGKAITDMYPVMAQVMVKVNSMVDLEDFRRYLDNNPYVGWHSSCAGRFDFVAYIRSSNNDHLGSILQGISHHSTVADMETLLLLEDKYKGMSKMLIS